MGEASTGALYRGVKEKRSVRRAGRRSLVKERRGVTEIGDDRSVK
jgi:hypothetical protein